MNDGRTADYPVGRTDDGRDAILHVQLTDEGVIADVIVDGEIVATWGQTAQELADGYCH